MGSFFGQALKGREDLSCGKEWKRIMKVFLSALSGPRLWSSFAPGGSPFSQHSPSGSHVKNKSFLPYMSSLGGHVIC